MLDSGGRLHLLDKARLQQTGRELRQHFDVVVGAAIRGGNHEDQLGRLAIFGAVLDTLTADTDGNGRTADRLALGVGQGDTLLEAGAVQLLASPDIFDKLLLIRHGAIARQHLGHLVEQSLLAGGLQLQADESAVGHGG